MGKLIFHKGLEKNASRLICHTNGSFIGGFQWEIGEEKRNGSY